MSFLNPTKMTLNERLRLHAQFTVTITAKDFTSEVGVLQKVGLRFICVSGQYFVPSSLDQINLLGFTPQVTGTPVTIRSTTRGTFPATLVRTGSDFVELLLGGGLVLIPLNKIISIEKS